MNVPKYLKMMIIEEAKQEIAVLRSPNKMLLFKSGELNEVLTKKKEEQTFVYIFKSVTGKLKCVLLNAVNKGPIFTVSAFSEFPFLTFFTKFPLKLKQKVAEIDLEGNVKNERAITEFHKEGLSNIYSLSTLRILEDPRRGREGEELFLKREVYYSLFSLISLTESFILLREYLEKVKMEECTKISSNSFLALSLKTEKLSLYELAYKEKDDRFGLARFFFKINPVEGVPPSKMFFRIKRDTFCVQEKETNKIFVFHLSRD